MNYNEEQLQSIARQYTELKLKYPDLMLLSHWGDRVEVYNRDAERFSRLTGLPVTESDKLKDGEGVPWKVVSFPANQVRKYMDMLDHFGIDYSIPSAVPEKSEKRGFIEEIPSVQQAADPYGVPQSTAAPLLRYDLRTDCVQAILPNGYTGAFIRPDRVVSYAENARFTDIQRQSIERMALQGNLVVQTVGKPKLALQPLNEPQFIYDSPKTESARKVVTVEEVDGHAYAVNGREIIGDFDRLEQSLRPNTGAVKDEIAERSARYLSAFRFRLYEAFMQGDPRRISKAEGDLHAAYRYDRQEAYDGAAVQSDIHALRRSAAQDEWLVYGDEGDRTFLVYAKLGVKDKFRPIDLENGKLVGLMDRATKVAKNSLDPVLQTLRASLPKGAQLQVRDTAGKVYYDTAADARQSLRLSEDFERNRRVTLLFTPNERTYGIDISVEGQGVCLHIAADRSIEQRGSYRLSAADMACIHDFARTDNMLFQSVGAWVTALDPLNETSKYFNDPSTFRRFPVSVERIDGSVCAIHDRKLVARNEQVGQLPDFTPEVVARFDEAARKNYERCKKAVIHACFNEDVEAEEKAVRDYLNAEKYLYTDRYSRHEAGERLNLIHDSVRETLNLVRQLRSGQDLDGAARTAETAPSDLPVETPDIGQKPGLEPSTRPLTAGGQPPAANAAHVSARVDRSASGQVTVPPASAAAASPDPGTQDREQGDAQQQGKEGREEKQDAENILIFKMDDGHYGIYEMKDGLRSHTRRLSDEDTKWFFNGIKDITPQQQAERRQALADKYIRQGFVPQAQKPYFPDVPAEIRKRIGRVNVFRVGTGNYNVRAVIDGEQRTGKLMRKADNNIFFEHYTNRPKEVKEETLVRLAALYFKEELREQSLDFGRTMHR